MIEEFTRRFSELPEVKASNDEMEEIDVKIAFRTFRMNSLCQEQNEGP